MSNHSKEPWSIHPKEPTFIRANDGKKHVGNTDSLGERETNEANARRIVAAVNACAGATTDSLEQHGFLAMRTRQVIELEQQRDELLDICRNVVERGIGASDVKAMREASAKVGTEKTAGSAA